MVEHTLDVLEFSKVKELVASYSLSILGRENILQLIPLANIDLIRRDLAFVNEFIDLLSFGDPLPLRGIKDIRVGLHNCQFEGAVLESNAFLDILDTLVTSRNIKAYFISRKAKYPLSYDIIEGIQVHQELEEEIQKTIDPAGKVKNSASLKLGRIRRELEAARSSLREKLESILDGLPSDVVQDRIITIREGRYVIPIRDGQRGRLKGIIHDRSDSGATVFVEPLATLDQNNLIRRLELEEKKEIERILRELTGQVRKVSGEIQRNLEILSKLDALYAKASYAINFKAVVPNLNEEGQIYLRTARHPLLVWKRRAAKAENDVVPLDIELGRNFDVLVITGPNAGGKTVALKTVGLLSLMVQAGLPIPTDPNSDLSVFKKIYADIGDEQSIENDLSTFSSHMKQIVEIVKQADRDTLVLLDEVGAGTDPDEGSALAAAVLKALRDRYVRTIATTHHGVLKIFAHEQNGMENGSMQFDLATLQPTFTFRLGVPGSSYAFEIAERFGLPHNIIESASQQVGPKAKKLEVLLADLENVYHKAEEENNLLKDARALQEKLANDYKEKLEEFQQEEKKLKREALEGSKKILAEANAIIEHTVAEIKRNQANSDSIKWAKESVRALKSEIEDKIETIQEIKSQPPDTEKLHPNDIVWVESFGREGRIVDIKSGTNRAKVQMGGLLMEVRLSQLRLIEGAQYKTKQKVFIPVSSVPIDSISTELDLRGMTFDEASMILDKYLDEVYLARINEVTIIHGKGTGVLREKVNNFLKNHPRVHSQRLGAWNEGGSGVTIVQLND